MKIGAILILSSCAKDGEVGPQGPAGNANVHTTTFSVAPGDWEQVGSQGQLGFGYSVEQTVSTITDAIASTGAVLVYRQVGTDGWLALPTTVTEGFGVNRNWLSVYGPGTVNIGTFTDNQQTPAITQTQVFKVVAIASSGMIPADVDLNNYEQVSRFYHLDE